MRVIWYATDHEVPQSKVEYRALNVLERFGSQGSSWDPGPIIPAMIRALFICSRNRLRSPTAQQVFAGRPGIETDSAGLAPDADTPLEPEQVKWADVIFVMEKANRLKLSLRFKTALPGERIVCLDIPDNYAFMQPELVALLEKKVAPHLR